MASRRMRPSRSNVIFATSQSQYFVPVIDIVHCPDRQSEPTVRITNHSEGPLMVNLNRKSAHPAFSRLNMSPMW
jgi:hypothetical protein